MPASSGRSGVLWKKVADWLFCSCMSLLEHTSDLRSRFSEAPIDHLATAWGLHARAQPLRCGPTGTPFLGTRTGYYALKGPPSCTLIWGLMWFVRSFSPSWYREPVPANLSTPAPAGRVHADPRSGPSP